jgi:hypothetical protein
MAKKLTECERSFAAHLLKKLDTIDVNNQNELRSLLMDLTFDENIGASNEYRKKVRNSLDKIFVGRGISLLKYTYNILLKADGMGV